MPDVTATIRSHDLRRVAANLDPIRVGAPSLVPGAHLVPLVRAAPRRRCLPVVDLHDAIASKAARIFEAQRSDHTVRVEVQNLGDTPLLVLGGTEIVGASAPSIIGTTRIAPAGKRLTFRGCSRDLAGLNAVVRLEAEREPVPDSRLLRRATASSTVRWDRLSRLAYGASRPPPSIAAWPADGSAAASAATLLERVIRGVRPVAHQVGVALVRHDLLSALELFGCPSLYARAHEAVVRQLLWTARSAEELPGRLPQGVVVRALSVLRSELRATAPSSSRPHVAGFRLDATVVDGAPYHLVVQRRRR